MDKRINWSLEIWDINKIRPYEKNPRVITEKGLNELARSFDEIGNAQPININTDGTILSGHARYQQLLKEGAKVVPVYVPDRKLTPRQEEAVIIRMNKNIAGDWDFDILANEFEIEDLVDWGFDEGEIPNIEVLEPEPDGDPDSVPEVPVEPVTKLGDVWLIGAYYECEKCNKKYSLDQGNAMSESCPCDNNKG